jgi:hypothetical protein
LTRDDSKYISWVLIAGYNTIVKKRFDRKCTGDLALWSVHFELHAGVAPNRFSRSEAQDGLNKALSLKGEIIQGSTHKSAIYES